MPSDDIIKPNTEAYGSAMHANATPPIVPSESTLSAVVTQVVPSAKNDPKPINVGSLDHSASHGNAINEVGRLAFPKSQGRTATSKKRKYSADNIAGRWTAAEHEAFLRGLRVYGREWKKVATCIPTRTSAQIRSHAQKYFTKVSKEQQQLLALTEQRRSPFPVGMPSKSDESFRNNDQPRSQSFTDTMNSMLSNPSAVESRVCKTLASLRERYKQLENHLQQNQAPASCDPPVQSGEAALGPATAALELEQKSLRKAAVARYEMKKRENQLRNKTETNGASCAHVSLSSIPSHGGFDSSDVIALSILGSNLSREKIENRTINDDSSLKLVRERLQLIERKRPTKLRKIDEH
eukprot:CAMPEP_0201888044 /NCGR_PEP_ID=MMETSP0902-20130614/26500_1 /ASSEMBLY_ACC=CAM_ASM_000551 /TAXON_ID=420261 /ORGANISM="Thalassiosira antarctica, Strain CCMP982" /LENGTH=351 /DNA_ID=CAMNT_0048418175 /DNA_START=280 /DNA_END=1335 /DNA_ORIENTATION=+